MEVFKKTKKLKKRRHRSDKIKKEKYYVEELLKNSDEKEDKVFKRVDPDVASQLVQTDLAIIEDNRNELNEKDEQIKSLTDRLQQVTSKLYESKNAYTSLKQDYNKVQKLLCSEVGENNVTTVSLLSQPGWRGRAEQIVQLQQKISELQLKLSDTDSTRKRSADRRSLSGVRLFDREKKQQIENLTKDLKQAEVAQESLKKKLEAAKARRSVLENDLSTSKKTVALLNEKTTHDNQLIEALHEQLKVAESKLQDKDLAIRRQSDKYEREIVLVKSELEAAHIHLKNLRRQIDDKEKELENLRLKNGRQTTVHHGVLDNDSCPESPPQSARSGAKNPNEYVAVGIAAEAERERLLEFVTVLNRRLDKERSDLEQLSDLLKKERSRAAKLETKLQKMELERVGLSSRANTGSYRFKTTKGTTISPSDKFGNLDEFQLKYELLQEECLTLKTRLATLQKEKAGDLATFKKMLEQTRQIFKDAYRGKLPMVGNQGSVITI